MCVHVCSHARVCICVETRGNFGCHCSAAFASFFDAVFLIGLELAKLGWLAIESKVPTRQLSMCTTMHAFLYELNSVPWTQVYLLASLAYIQAVFPAQILCNFLIIANEEDPFACKIKPVWPKSCSILVL